MSEPKEVSPCLFKEQKNLHSSLCPSGIAEATHISCLLFLKIDMFARLPWRLVKLSIVNITTVEITLVHIYITTVSFGEKI